MAAWCSLALNTSGCCSYLPPARATICSPPSSLFVLTCPLPLVLTRPFPPPPPSCLPPSCLPPLPRPHPTTSPPASYIPHTTFGLCSQTQYPPAPPYLLLILCPSITSNTLPVFRSVLCFSPPLTCTTTAPPSSLPLRSLCAAQLLLLFTPVLAVATT